MILIFDVEATGLNVSRDRVWCVVAKNYETGEVYEFRPNQLDRVKDLFDSAKILIGHNVISYDKEILKNNGIVEIPFGKIVDTLVLSRLYYPDREDGHSVEAWGQRLGFPKVEHEDWSRFSEDMLHRCRTDVEIQTKIYDALLRERGGWDWTLSERIEHKVAKILHEQEENGWKFRVEDAKKLVEWLEGEMERMEQEIQPMLPLYCERKGEVKKPFVKSGAYSKMSEDWLDEVRQYSNNCYVGSSISGCFGRIEWHPVSLSQRDKLAQALIFLGWKPTSYTDKGSPQITPNKEPCPNLDKLPGGIGPKLSHYFLCNHRRGQIQGWIDNVREDGRLPSVAIGNSTNTGRMAHRIIANVPKASESVFLGPEMRDLFTHEEGYTLVGWDAEGLELRVLAHYMNDPEFTEAIVNGRKEDKTDIHNLMLQASDGIVPDRDTVKNCVYAIVYGAGDWKLGRTAGYSKGASQKGKSLRQSWNARFPKLPQLVEQVTKAAERGYLKAIDGRKVWMRRDPTGKVMSHKGLNTLIQATGSIIVKTADCYLTHYTKSANLDARQLIVYHDEVIAEAAPKDLDKYVELCYTSMNKTERLYGFRCPLSIEVKSGKSWREVH